MNRLLIFLILTISAVGTFSVLAATVEPTDTVATKVHGPILRLENKEVDLGLFAASEKTEGSVKFYNDGDEPLIITKVFSDCHCTSPSYTHESVAPGESGEIKISFNGSGMSYGNFTKVLRVRSNALNAKEVLYVKGQIKRPYKK